MTIPILSTKLFIPSLRSSIVSRPRLLGRLNESLNRKLTLVSAPAGSGKTTLVSDWLANGDRPVGWVSLDEEDNEPARFLTYLAAAFQSAGAKIGEGIFGLLQSPQPPPVETVLSNLLQEAAAFPTRFVLVLDDFHVIHAGPIDDAVSFLLERMPPQMHLVITAREEPRLPLARLRVRDQLTEVRAADLRFTAEETADFLVRVIGLNLSPEDLVQLESRTEGWIAALQLAALSMKGHKDVSGFIRSFTGDHHFVADYLVEEVLRQQPEYIQTFLLRTSILDRFCGSLSDAVLRWGGDSEPLSSSQEMLEYLERANLFIIPLDHERRWYRYHHLFADFLRRRLRRSMAWVEAEIHTRASEWFEENGLELEAFQHAVNAHDVARASRLAEGNGMPLLFRGAVAPVLKWLDSQPKDVLDSNPSLYVMHASALLMTGQMTGVEQKLQAADRALQNAEEDERIRDLLGHIASIRATLAVSRHEAEAIMAESRRALEYLHPDNIPVRTATSWTLGYAYQLKGDRAAAGKAYLDALSMSRRIGHVVITMMASLGLGNIQEADNRLYEAAETYRYVLTMAGEPPLPAACEAHLRLARIHYEWNDLIAAERHGQSAVQLARRLEQTDRAVASELFLARLKLARGEVSGAAAILAEADSTARQHSFDHQLPHIATLQALTLIYQGNLQAAVQLARKYELHVISARVHMAQGDALTALELLEPLLRHAEGGGWPDERLKVMVPLSVAIRAQGENQKAMQMLLDALTMAEPGGFTRIFVDEGPPMERLLREAAGQHVLPEYIGRLLAAFGTDEEGSAVHSRTPAKHRRRPDKPLVEPLSDRELEVLQLIAQGLSNHEISERLFLALSTVKGHNRIIFDKLQVARRTEAVARARELGLL